MGINSIANSNDGDHLPPLFSWPLDCRYRIRFYSISCCLSDIWMISHLLATTQQNSLVLMASTRATWLNRCHVSTWKYLFNAFRFVSPNIFSKYIEPYVPSDRFTPEDLSKLQTLLQAMITDNVSTCYIWSLSQPLPSLRPQDGTKGWLLLYCNVLFVFPAQVDTSLGSAVVPWLRRH